MGIWLFLIFFMLFGECVSLGHIPRSGIVGSQGLCVFRFGRSHQTVFQSGCTRLRPILTVSKSFSCSASLPTLGIFYFDGHVVVCHCLLEAEYLNTSSRVYWPFGYPFFFFFFCEVLFKSFVESAILKTNYYSPLWYNSGSVDKLNTGVCVVWFFYVSLLKIYVPTSLFTNAWNVYIKLSFEGRPARVRRRERYERFF